MHKAMKSRLSRRNLLKAGAVAVSGVLLGACQPEVVEKVVEKEVTRVVKEEVEVEGTPQVVEKVITVVPEEPEETVTLNFLNRGGEYIAGVMDEQMSLYKETHPNIEFEINAVPGYSHQETLLMMISAGTGPDMWFDANRTTGMLTEKGVTLNLEPYFEADPNFNEDDFVENVWIAQTYRGDRWGIPWDSGAMYMTFNMDLFDEAGLDYPDPQEWLTWDDIVELAKPLTIDMDGNTANDPGFNPERVRQYGYLPAKGHGYWTYVHSNNGNVFAPDGTMPVDSPEFVETMNWLADLALVEHVSPTPSAEQATELDIRSGNVAMQHSGAWEIGRFNEAGLNWGMFQVPYSKTRVSYGHYSPLCVFSRSDHPDEAYEFCFFAGASKEGSNILVKLGMQQPIRKDLRDEFLNNEPPERKYLQVAYDAFENEETFRWPGDQIGSYWGGWYQLFIELWEPYKDQLWMGEVRWEDVASEVREKSEYVLENGELP